LSVADRRAHHTNLTLVSQLDTPEAAARQRHHLVRRGRLEPLKRRIEQHLAAGQWVVGIERHTLVGHLGDSGLHLPTHADVEHDRHPGL